MTPRQTSGLIAAPMRPELNRAMRINREVRDIIHAAMQVNFVALNASLTARKAGSRSVGFAVVARELRILAGEMERTMASLDRLIGHLVAGIAAQIRDGRLLASILAAGEACETVPACVAAMSARLRHRSDGWRSSVAEDRVALLRDCRHALRLSEMGRALARNGKVEAAHGGVMSAALGHVAEQMEAHVDQVCGRLRRLNELMARIE